MLSRPLALSPVMNTFALIVFDYFREGISRSWHRELLFSLTENLQPSLKLLREKRACPQNFYFCTTSLRKLTESFLFGPLLTEPPEGKSPDSAPSGGVGTRTSDSRGGLHREFHCLLPTVVLSARSFYCGKQPLRLPDHRAGSSFRNVFRFGFRVGFSQSRLGQSPMSLLGVRVPGKQRTPSELRNKDRQSGQSRESENVIKVGLYYPVEVKIWPPSRGLEECDSL